VGRRSRGDRLSAGWCRSRRRGARDRGVRAPHTRSPGN
jgi:hypothetical protein